MRTITLKLNAYDEKHLVELMEALKLPLSSVMKAALTEFYFKTMRDENEEKK